MKSKKTISGTALCRFMIIIAVIGQFGIHFTTVIGKPLCCSCWGNSLLVLKSDYLKPSSTCYQLYHRAKLSEFFWESSKMRISDHFRAAVLMHVVCFIATFSEGWKKVMWVRPTVTC